MCDSYQNEEEITNCVIMAGGRGERLRPLTDTIPKCALEVGGKPVIKHIIDDLEAVGFDDIIVSLKYLPGGIKTAIGEDETIRYYIQKTTGTAQCLKEMDRYGYLESEFMVVIGYTLSNLNYAQIIEWHLINNNIATIFTKDDAIHSGGTYIFDREVLKYIDKEVNIPDLIQKLMGLDISMSLYMGENPQDVWYLDIGDPAKLKEARELFK